MYVDYLYDYHQLERAIRTNNVDQFVQALSPIIALFFETNHINYARWLSKFQLDLHNIDSTHPGLRHILEQGAFTVRRTENSFSRAPVDLALEQTVNRDAASRLTGITAMTNNYNARLRWMLTKAARTALVSKLQEITGVNSKQDVIADMRPSKLKRNTSDLKRVIEQIKETCNPFKEEPKDMLFNISTGKVASEAVKTCLLGLEDRGTEHHKKFIEECIENPNRFEEALKTVKLLKFRNECASNAK